MMNYNAWSNNPYLNPQERMNQLVAQYPQYFNQQTQQATMPQANGLRTLPVTNKEEAIATPVDLSGVPTFFYNKGKDEVYLKQVDVSTGNAIVKDYVPREVIPKPVEPIKKEESINPYEKDFKAINERLDGIKKLLTPDIIETIEEKTNRNAKRS